MSGRRGLTVAKRLAANTGSPSLPLSRTAWATSRQRMDLSGSQEHLHSSARLSDEVDLGQGELVGWSGEGWSLTPTPRP